MSEWDQPESAVLDRATDLLGTGRRGVLATLVGVDGSAYRRPGAKLLLPEEGEGSGAITAGCLEHQLQRLAADVLAAGEASIETFDLSADDDTWGLGIGCDGVVDVLLEPIDDSLRPALAAHDAGEACAVLTVLDGGDTALALGDRACYRAGEGFTATRGDWPDRLRDRVIGPAENLAADGGSETISDGELGVSVFVDGIAPPPRLLVVGTGPEVPPVVELAARTGFRVTVAGYRGGRTDPDRFPDASSVVSTSPGNLTEAVAVDADTYAVVMTHNFVDDRLSVASLLETPAPYVGMVGSRDRSEEILDAIEREAALAAAEGRIYAPVGLDLGGGAPAQIALSIVSEVLAVHNDRTGGHLRDREGPIHDRTRTED